MNKVILALLAVLVPIPLSAAILSPYIVDEKPRVITSDSIIVGNYYGLENYKADYVGGYAHISFTYTHDSCCFSSNSPRIYITNVDPRSTSTPIVRYSKEIFWLIGNLNPIDWYLYDVQFDETGYTSIVKQAGEIEIYHEHINVLDLNDSDWVALTNLHEMGIPVANMGSMAFMPVPITNSAESEVTNPVIIVPGIMSSVLGNNENEKWPNIPSMSLSIEDLYLNDLALDQSGEDFNSVSAFSIIKNIGTHDFYNGLISNLTNYYDFPYDWRLDIESSTLSLKEKIDKIKTEKGVEKVDLIAHSMGGLLVKKYLKNYGGDSIGKFVDIGTPHTGSPKSFKILNYGDNFGFEKFGLDVLNPHRVKVISQNMPSIYQLLPSQEYFDDSDNEYKYYVFNAASGEDKLTFEETRNYLKATGRNGLLVDRAKAFHQEIDNLNPADYGVQTYNIVGCGTPTIGQFYILQEGDHPIYNIRMINGDGTVPLKSAEAMTAFKTYYVRNAQHALMPSTSGVKELVSGLLISTSTEFDISPFSNLNLSAEGCSIPNGKIVSFHSPIELHIHDNIGNHAGPDSKGDIENKINGVVYEIIGDNKFAYLPDRINYEVIGIPTGPGTFDIRIQSIVNGKITALNYWNQLSISQTSFSVGNEVPTIILDVPASAILNQDQANDITKPITEIKIKGNEKTPGSYISSVHVTLAGMDDNSGVLKTEYSRNDGKTWIRYNEPILINDRGGVKLMYKSTDKAGNVEIVKSKIINIIQPGNSGNKK